MYKQTSLFTYINFFIFCILLTTIHTNSLASPKFLDMGSHDWREFKTENDIMKIKININKSNDYGWYLVMLKNFSANTSYVFQILDEINEIPNSIIVKPENIFYAEQSDFDEFDTKGNLVFITTAPNLPKDTVIQFRITNTSKQCSPRKYERILYVNKISEFNKTIIENETTSDDLWLNIISTNKATPKDDDWVYLEKTYAQFTTK
ncbi:MAG: hypothetical protein HRT87_04915 [Legionellales bacterium]|nr:hypothetical protein [Legionellales bacterium]